MAGQARTASAPARRARLLALLTATLVALGSGAVLAAPASALNPPLTITTTSLPAGSVAAPYAVALTASGGQLPWTWSVASGLPPGLGVDLGGIISGTPTTVGTFNFTAQVTDGASAVATHAESITINPQLTITTATLPSAVVGTPYSTTLAGTGGTLPYTWSLSSGTLPAGLSLTSAGVISGTPTSAGPAAITVELDDNVGAFTTQPLLLTVKLPLAVATTTLPAATVGVPYSTTLDATGGTTPYGWSLSTGTLPAGLAISSAGVISGTPTTAGTSNFDVTVTDAAAGTATQSLAITVNPAPLAISTTTLPGGTVGTAYSTTLAATGGTTPYSWSLSTGSLPAGLAISSAGVISGTPTTAGTSNFDVTVTDAAAVTKTTSLSITVAPTVPPLSITTSTLPGGTVGAAYSTPLAATGGATPYTWSVSIGSLPAGLAISSAGVISGTPTSAGTSTFTVKVTDAATHSTTTSLSITVAPAVPPLVISTTTLPVSVVGSAYSTNLAATGGTTPYTWSVSVGSLPAGLAISSAGVISGTPTSAGTSTFTVKVTDAATHSTTKSLSITVAPPLVITTTSLPAATVGVPYSTTLGATGGKPPYTWSLASGALPPGLAISSAGVISGTPTAAGPSNFMVKVADDPIATATRGLTLSVNPPVVQPGIALTADNVSPRSRGIVTLSAQVNKPPSGFYFVVIVDVTRNRIVGFCGDHNLCRTHVLHRQGPHTYEARLVSLVHCWAPWRTVAVSRRVTVTWAPPVLTIQHGRGR